MDDGKNVKTNVGTPNKTGNKITTLSKTAGVMKKNISPQTLNSKGQLDIDPQNAESSVPPSSNRAKKEQEDVPVDKNDTAIFEYQNMARMHPEYIVSKLKKALQKKEFVEEYTAELIKEALHDMSVKKPAPTLVWDQGMFLACREHINDLGPKGKLDHKGSDGKTVFERINRHGKYLGICGENFIVGKERPKDVILGLIIDHNNPKKQNRRALMEQKFVKGAVCSGQHAKYGTWTVFAYTGQ